MRLKIFYLAMFMLLSMNTVTAGWAPWDYSMSSLMRSFPSSFYVNGTVGRGYNIWGSGEVMRGYIRPSATVQSSIFINTAKVQLDFFPISFIGAYAGKARVNRDYDKFQTFDCDVVICRGILSRTYYGAKMALALGPIFLMNDARIEKVEMRDKEGIFAEEQGTLLAQSGHDYLYSNLALLGVNFGTTWSGGVLSNYSRMKFYPNDTLMNILFTQYKSGPYSILGGPGYFRTREDHDVFTVMVLFKWVGSKGAQLF